MTVDLADRESAKKSNALNLETFLQDGAIVSGTGNSLFLGIGPVQFSSAPITSGLSIFAPDFLLTNPRPWRNYSDYFELDREHFLRELEGFLSEQSRQNVSYGSKLRDWSYPDFLEFRDRFQRVSNLIAKGDLVKAVPVISKTSPKPIGLTKKVSIIKKALSRIKGYPLIAYGFWDEREGLLGMTPEQLFTQRQDGLVSTIALAGTRSRTSSGENLFKDTKEVHEHQIVIDGICERLKELGSLKVGETIELELPSLVHLQTEITISPFSPTSFKELVSALHPTPAIGAWPLEAGKQWVTNEPGSTLRKRHGAPFGIVVKERNISQCLVAIRCVQWDESGTQLVAGSGIVAESQLDREWIELKEKLDSVQNALDL